MPHPSRDFLTVTRAVVWNQTLWTAGHSLTSGGFLIFFAREFGARPFLIALLMAIPETVGPAALATRWAADRLGTRRQAWIVSSLAARAVALGIPLMAFTTLRPQGIDPLWVMAACLALAHALQAVGYTALLSWLTDLVPEQRWGRFFAVRSIADRCVLLVLLIAVGVARDSWQDLAPRTRLLAYVVTFGAGTVLQIVSLLPLLPLPDAARRPGSLRLPDWRLVAAAWRMRSLRFLLIHNWSLAFFNGLTQSVFFLYATNVFRIQLGIQNTLNAVMGLTMIPVGWLAGILCDRSGEKRVLAVSVAVASCGLVFWIASAPQSWGLLFAAYFLWGAYAAANISGQNLLLKLAPRGDNTAHIALFRHIGGMFAGISGVLGGLWLDQLLKGGTTLENLPLSFLIASDPSALPYRLIILVSLAGRLSSIFWLIPVRQPPETDPRRT